MSLIQTNDLAKNIKKIIILMISAKRFDLIIINMQKYSKIIISSC